MQPIQQPKGHEGWHWQSNYVADNQEPLNILKRFESEHPPRFDPKVLPVLTDLGNGSRYCWAKRIDHFERRSRSFAIEQFKEAIEEAL